MRKPISIVVAATVAALALAPTVYSQERKQQQVHKGTAEQGTVQKKEQKRDQKKDGTGGAMQKGAEGKK